MKIKALHIVSAAAFIALTQLLFFWLIPTESKAFVAVYPFYTVLTLAHTALLTYICAKYKYPASFAPVFSGSVITIGEIVAGLLLGLLCSSIRSIIFVQAIIVVAYVLVMAFFCAAAARESVTNELPAAPVVQYGAAHGAVAASAAESAPKRMPKPANSNPLI